MHYFKDSQGYVGTGTAAKILNVSVGTVQSMVDRGFLTTYTTAGKHRRIKYDALVKYVEQTTGESLHKNKSSKIGIIYSDTFPPNCLEALEGNDNYVLISDPTQLIQLGSEIKDLFLDARLPWVNWRLMSRVSQKQVNYVIYNSQVLELVDRVHLEDFAILMRLDISEDLLQGYKMAISC
jgi:excisionase family DNA binding protein